MDEVVCVDSERRWKILVLCFLAASISSWDELSSSFIEQFDGWVDVKLMLDQLMEIQIEQDELIPGFNSRFYKTLMDIPKNCRPSDQICLVIYLGALDSKMSYLVRDK